MTRFHPRLVYCLFAVALLVASSPAWRLLLGNDPGIEALLQIRCLGF